MDANTRTRSAITQAQWDQANTRVAAILVRIAQMESGIQQTEQEIAHLQTMIDQSQANLEPGRLLAAFDKVITHKSGEVRSLAVQVSP